MNIDKAIEILSDEAYKGSVTFNLDRKDAVKLGIEALKREENYRMAHPDVAPYLLPGETED